MFTLDFDIPRASKKINLKDPILLIGSCFSNEIGNKLAHHKFNICCNPLGTIYNPFSIFQVLKEPLQKDRLVKSQGIYYHWDAHGSISGLNKQEVDTLFTKKIQEIQQFLRQAKWLIITLGTAFVYEHSTSGIVANCHKVPSDQFKKRLLNQQEILKQFASLHDHLNPQINIILTVSPVRHIREGLIANNRSKAILIDAVHQLVAQYTNLHYFPSYEILIDELRDYRFYAQDMIHPSTQAIDYIWGRFSRAYFDQETQLFLDEWSKISASLSHRPFHPHASSHQAFLRSILKKLNSLNEKIDVSVEIDQVRKQLK